MTDVSTFLEMQPSTVRGMINNPLTIKIYERDALSGWLRIPAMELDAIFHEHEEVLTQYLPVNKE